MPVANLGADLCIRFKCLINATSCAVHWAINNADWEPTKCRSYSTCYKLHSLLLVKKTNELRLRGSEDLVSGTIQLEWAISAWIPT